MKIAEVQPGMIVGVIKGRKADYRELPREAEVVEIVTREERTWNSLTGEEGTPRKIRAVKVRMVSDPLEDVSTYYGARLHSFPKGHETVIEPAQIVAEWSKLRESVAKQIKEQREKVEAQAALEARLIALFGKRSFESYITARATGRGQQNEISFYGPPVQKVLEALEYAQVNGAL